MNCDGYLIGSRALAHWMMGFPESDWDVISPEPIEGTEWHNPLHLNNGIIAETFGTDSVISLGKYKFSVVSMEGLAIIKRSHLWRHYNFDKHISHWIKQGLRNCFVESDLVNHPLYVERLELTKKAYPQPHPKLNMLNEEFFDDFVKKKYDHDWLHQMVCYHSRPLYMELQTDGTRAWCHKELWDKLTENQKTQCVSEEVMVISLERFLIPSDWDLSPKRAYMRSLNKVCTTLCSGWFRDHAIDHYDSVVDLFDKSRFEWMKEYLTKYPNAVKLYGD